MNFFKTLTLTFLVIVCAGCHAPTSCQNVATNEVVGAVLSQEPTSHQAIDDVIAALTKALKNTPANVSLLITRANYYGVQGAYKRAIHDINHASRLTRLPPEVHMSKCMYMEKIHGFTTQTHHCYNAVLHTYNDIEGNREYPSGNHVIAAIMAKSPSAPRLKREFLNQSSNSAMKKKLIKQFKRQRFIKTALP